MTFESKDLYSTIMIGKSKVKYNAHYAYILYKMKKIS